MAENTRKLGWRTGTTAVLIIAAEAWLTTQPAWHHATRHHEAVACIAVAAAIAVVWGVVCNVFRRASQTEARNSGFEPARRTGRY